MKRNSVNQKYLLFIKLHSVSRSTVMNLMHSNALDLKMRELLISSERFFYFDDPRSELGNMATGISKTDKIEFP